MDVSESEMKHGRMAESMKEMLRVFLEEEISEYYGTKADEKWKFELKIKSVFAVDFKQ